MQHAGRRTPFEIALPSQDRRCEVVAVEERLGDLLSAWGVSLSPEVSDSGFPERCGVHLKNAPVVLAARVFFSFFSRIAAASSSGRMNVDEHKCLRIVTVLSPLELFHLPPFPFLPRVRCPCLQPSPENYQVVCLIQSCLVSAPDRRPSLEMLLRHPWMQA